MESADESGGVRGPGVRYSLRRCGCAQERCPLFGQKPERHQLKRCAIERGRSDSLHVTIDEAIGFQPGTGGADLGRDQARAAPKVAGRQRRRSIGQHSQDRALPGDEGLGSGRCVGGWTAGRQDFGHVDKGRDFGAQILAVEKVSPARIRRSFGDQVMTRVTSEVSREIGRRR